MMLAIPHELKAGVLNRLGLFIEFSYEQMEVIVII